MDFQWIVVERDECSLDVLSELGTKAATAWIEFDQSVVDDLRSFAHYFLEEDGYILALWEEQASSPETSIILARTNDGYELICARAEDISFTEPVEDPDRILMFTMK